MPQKCACGKVSTTVERESCEDGLPTCENVCGRHLKCGIHKCTKTCHDSPCSDCKEEVKVSCRCGKKTVMMTCEKFKQYQLKQDVLHQRENWYNRNQQLLWSQTGQFVIEESPDTKDVRLFSLFFGKPFFSRVFN
jgi:hypothetical protein